MKELKINSVAKIIETFLDDNALHVGVVEEYLPCFSLMLFLEEAAKIRGVPD